MSPFLTQTYKRAGLDVPASPVFPPVIVVDPADQTILSGQTASMSVTATGTDLHYQWYEGETGDTDTPISGATLPSYTTPTLTAPAQYWVRVTNPYGSDDSETADITIGELPAGVLAPPTYLGMFDLDDQGALYTRTSYTSIAGRRVDGVLKLYLMGTMSESTEQFKGSIVEVTDPGTYSFDYLSAPQATTHLYAGEWKDKRYSWTRNHPEWGTYNPGLNAINTSLYWHEGNQLLYTSFTDYYDVVSSQTHCLIAIKLVPNMNPPYGGTIGYGPWQIGGTHDVQTITGPRICQSIDKHPVTGDLVCGSSLISGNANCTFGPSYWTGAPFPTETTPVGVDEVTTMPDLGMWHYFMGGLISDDGLPSGPLKAYRRRQTPSPHEYFPPGECGVTTQYRVNPELYSDAIGFTGSWTDFDYVTGMTYCQVGSKAAWVYTAALVSGHNWYRNACHLVCTHGLVPQPGSPGPVSTESYPALIAYSADDVQSAIDGDVDEWALEPAWEVNCDTAYNIRTAPLTETGGKTIGGGYFDTVTGRYYAMAVRASAPHVNIGAGHIIHVWQFTE